MIVAELRLQERKLKRARVYHSRRPIVHSLRSIPSKLSYLAGKAQKN